MKTIIAQVLVNDKIYHLPFDVLDQWDAQMIALLIYSTMFNLGIKEYKVSHVDMQCTEVDLEDIYLN